MKKAAVWMVMLGCAGFAVAGGDIGTSVEPEVAVPMVAEPAQKSGFYAGLGAGSQRTYSVDSAFFDEADTQDETAGIVGLLGYHFNDYLAVEGRIGKSIAYEDYADVLSYSLFLKPQYPVTESIRVYALLGLGGVQVDGANGDTPAHADTIGKEILDETGFQWGLGGSYAFTENISLFADYTSLAKDADISSTLYEYDTAAYGELSSDAVTVGVTYQF